MQTNVLTTRYSFVAQAFHWLTAGLVLVAFLISPGGSEARVYSATAEGTRVLHESIGALVFAVVALRLAWRMFNHPPELPGQSAWMNRAAKSVHIALYVLLFLTPVTAVVGAWYEGHSISLYGIGDIVPALTQAHDLGATIANVHGFLGDAILWIAGLHAAAALYHHFFLRDAVLAAMVPGLQPPHFL